MACPPYFLCLALLASPIVDVIFAGKAPWTLSLTELDTTLSYSWKEQMKLFGILSFTKDVIPHFRNNVKLKCGTMSNCFDIIPKIVLIRNQTNSVSP